MPHPFQGKVIWITGASSGIGAALVREFDALGAKVIASGRNEEKLSLVISESRGSVHILPFDLLQSEVFPQVVQKAWAIHGNIFMLINNAGLASDDLIENISLEVDRKVMEVNYFSSIALTKLILPKMIDAGEGYFVAISSLSGKFGVPKLSSYAASKHALHGFYESLRAEYFKKNITVSIVIPGFIKTQITQKALKGDGSISGRSMKVNEFGMLPSDCAKKIIKGLIKKKEEIIVGKMETNTVWLKRFFPAWFSKFIRNRPVKKMRSLLGKK